MMPILLSLLRLISWCPLWWQPILPRVLLPIRCSTRATGRAVIAPRSLLRAVRPLSSTRGQALPGGRLAASPRRLRATGGRWALPLVLASIAVLLVQLGGCASPPPPAAQVTPVDRVLVKKGQRKLQLIRGNEVYREYRISLGGNPIGHKVKEGDQRTPEGDYILDWRNPNSNFHRSIHVSYPNTMDRAVARALGVSPGGMIMIHGRPNWLTSERLARAEYDGRDWTNGCIAVTNDEMDEIWDLVRDGTPIRILP